MKTISFKCPLYYEMLIKKLKQKLELNTSQIILLGIIELDKKESNKSDNTPN